MLLQQLGDVLIGRGLLTAGEADLLVGALLGVSLAWSILAWRRAAQQTTAAVQAARAEIPAQVVPVLNQAAEAALMSYRGDPIDQNAVWVEPPPKAAAAKAPTRAASAARKGTLAALVGAAAATILVAIVPQFEGTILRGYLDPIGIPTKCMGDNTDVVVGYRYTEAECQVSLERQLIAHAAPVLAACQGWRGGPTRSRPRCPSPTTSARAPSAAPPRRAGSTPATGGAGAGPSTRTTLTGRSG